MKLMLARARDHGRHPGAAVIFLSSRSVQTVKERVLAFQCLCREDPQLREMAYRFDESVTFTLGTEAEYMRTAGMTYAILPDNVSCSGGTTRPANRNYLVVGRDPTGVCVWFRSKADRDEETCLETQPLYLNDLETLNEFSCDMSAAARW
jgi:hypothetical protein